MKVRFTNFEQDKFENIRPGRFAKFSSYVIVWLHTENQIPSLSELSRKFLLVVVGDWVGGWEKI